MISTGQIDSIVKEGCPFGRLVCSLADLGGCSIVNQWRYDSRAYWTPSVTYSNPAMKSSASKGGKRGAETRRFRKAARW